MMIDEKQFFIICVLEVKVWMSGVERELFHECSYLLQPGGLTSLINIFIIYINQFPEKYHIHFFILSVFANKILTVAKLKVC